MGQIVLDTGFRMHETSQDLANEAIIGRMYGQYNRRGPWFYAHGVQGLGGLGWDGASYLPPGQNPLQVGGTDYSTGSPVWIPEDLRQKEPAMFMARWRSQYCDAPVTPVGVFPSDDAGCLAVGSAKWWATQGPYAEANIAQQAAYAKTLADNPALTTPTSQAVASQVTGKPNQSVPPQNPLTPMAPAIARTGDALSQQLNTPLAPQGEGGNTMLYVALAVGALFLMGRK